MVKSCLPAGRVYRVVANMYYVYILKSIHNDIFYKGQTENIERRLIEHFSGKMSATRHILPVELIHVEICTTRESARKLEVFFKSGYGREILREIAENI